MRHIETMKGIATVTSNGEEQVAVQYELHVYQDDIPADNLIDPHATIPGMKSIERWVSPVRFFGENGLTLEMQDGRKLKFFFQGSADMVQALDRITARHPPTVSFIPHGHHRIDARGAPRRPVARNYPRY
jgi:hypothetical protein